MFDHHHAGLAAAEGGRQSRVDYGIQHRGDIYAADHENPAGSFRGWRDANGCGFAGVQADAVHDKSARDGVLLRYQNSPLVRSSPMIRQPLAVSTRP